MTLEQQTAEKKAVALSSVFASMLLTGGKMAVGLYTGSLGILSEAAHSAMDLFAALVTYFAVRVSDRPADEEHHYGHAKVENFSALIEALLLLLTCVWIIKEAVSRLFFVHVPIEVNVWSFTILVVSIVVDFSRSRALSRAAEKYNSQALEADALHFSSDILSSAVVLVGLVFARFGINYADPVAAFIVAVIVIVASLRLTWKTVNALLDKAPRGLDRDIATEVMETPGVVGVHKVRLREAGGRIHGDLHVVIDRNISFVEGHRIASLVEEKLSRHSNDILVHFEPEDDWEAVNSSILRTEQAVIRLMGKKSSGILGYHSLVVRRGPGGTDVSIHVVLPKDISVSRAREYCDDIERDIKTELDDANMHFHIEPCEGICTDCEVCPDCEVKGEKTKK
ncbi:cation diffusion facilitator family transporter [Phosphitispora fastidiosa]|uniref:cation diffusion facilitator family transporter n=1 Tax=Phosphitispora fastidiosa TaxID=2837202 RepID=UPI001E603829|nr:cation diffusion facilitator family transporter [Phosphitispora fastidiosa]MBU7007642.1 cation diffusion facilitator family transporter [Phosphitispora fastidiosa]